MYNYFPHPSNCRMSPSVLRMLMKEGVSGYGVYWMVLEVLRDSKDFKAFYFPESMAYAFHVQDVSLIERVCKDYGLFEFDDDSFFWSPWLMEQMGAYRDKAEKLREAGRRGAARRWAAAHKDDGEAIATPSGDDGVAIAYNINRPDKIKQDKTQPYHGNEEKVGPEYLEIKCRENQEGHACGYVAQVCMHYGVSVSVCDLILEATDQANLENGTYKRFCSIVKRIQGEKWKPSHPDGFFRSRILEYGNEK